MGAANFNLTNDMMVEYSGFALKLVVSKIFRTLKKPVSTIWEKPEQKY